MDAISRRDIDFLLHDWLRVETLAAHPRFEGQSREDYDAVLDLAGKIAAKLGESWKISDSEEPRLDQDGLVRVQPDLREGVQEYFASGLQLSSVDEAHGGMQLPFVVSMGIAAQCMAANVAAAAFPMLSTANARVTTAFGTEAQIAAFAAPLHSGEAMGTMCLSEPDVGSSLGDITTKARAEGEDDLGRRHRIFGRKMWISVGDQDVAPQTIHLVLAKIEREDGTLPPGSKGISLFLVPKILPDGARNDVQVIGLNHKMGYRGTPNTLLNFGEGDRFQPGGDAGAVGWLIGAPGQGLAIMFQMMNEARISVGLGAAALTYRGYLASKTYAEERVQGRPLDDKRAEKPVPLTRHADVRRMILAQKAAAEGALALCLYAAKLADLGESEDAAEREKAEGLLGILTPIVKTWPSEMGLIANQHAIQIHGGYGYTRDFDVEQIYRDNRLNPIHEGTTGIQGLDLLGRKMLFDGMKSFALLMAEIRGEIAACADGPLSAQAAALEGACAQVEAAAAKAAEGDPAAALTHGSQVLHAMGHLVVGWLWLSQTRAAQGAGDDALAQAKLWACRYFFAYEAPMIAAWLAPLMAGDDTTGAVPEAAL
ncbi:acyl-CoA dehydrogenase [Rhodovulum sp. DZ06]|uniref:acyl-CoA dehydrogenase n=1 Tax=Rhodovulum sp. DZ06 TaxID=3425126 RepID=UPI003D351746